MTAIVFLIALAAAWVHFHAAGYFVTGGLTIYVSAFVAVRATATMFAIISLDRRCILGAVVLLLNFVGSFYAWQASNVLLTCAAVDLATAAWFALYGNSRWEFTTGSIFVVSVLVSGLTHLGLIPDSAHRPDVYIAWSHPDLTAILGHMASIALGLGAGDAGSRVRLALRRRPVAADYRRGLALGLVALAKMPRQAKR